jgi:phosphoheptose isomerase (EC 5.3.1.-)
VLVLVLAGCVSQPSRGPSLPRSPNDARLDAVQQSLNQGDLQSAEQGLSTLQTNQLNGREYARFRLLHGELALARHDPEAAVRALPANPGSGPFAAQILKLRGQALFQLHRPVAATAALVQRERLLPDSDEVSANRDLIWNNLLAQPLDPQHLAGLATADPVTRGWVQLAQLAQHHADLQALEAWGQRYPDHPANARLAELMMQGPSQASVLGQAPPAGSGPAVLLLPTSGRLQNAAQLVQSGFRAVAASVDPVDRSPVALDTDTQPATTAYQQAIAQGAGLIIGPLRKSEVQSLARQSAPQVPILALNYLDGDAAAVPGLYQFGLAPDDEARADADNAYAQGLSRVAALVPNDARGQRILAALTQRVEKLGGQVVTSQTYPDNAQSYTDQIRQLLGIDASLAREQAVAAAIGSKPKFTPRRRRDIDYLFFAANRSQARVIWPQLRYFGAWNIPTYTLSVVADKGRITIFPGCATAARRGSRNRTRSGPTSARRYSPRATAGRISAASTPWAWTPPDWLHACVRGRSRATRKSPEKPASCSSTVAVWCAVVWPALSSSRIRSPASMPRRCRCRELPCRRLRPASRYPFRHRRTGSRPRPLLRRRPCCRRLALERARHRRRRCGLHGAAGRRPEVDRTQLALPRWRTGPDHARRRDPGDGRGARTRIARPRRRRRFGRRAQAPQVRPGRDTLSGGAPGTPRPSGALRRRRLRRRENAVVACGFRQSGVDMSDLRSRLEAQFEASMRTQRETLASQGETLERAIEALARAIAAGNKILACGNGGSAADAQHFCAELVVRFERERPALPAIALTTDSSALTAAGNDYGYEQIFARQVQALARGGDWLLAISTSGHSPSVLRAVEATRPAGAHVLALTGRDGGALARSLQDGDLELRAASPVTARIQETHILLLHCLCDGIDHRLFPNA